MDVADGPFKLTFGGAAAVSWFNEPVLHVGEALGFVSSVAAVVLAWRLGTSNGERIPRGVLGAAIVAALGYLLLMVLDFGNCCVF